MEMEIYNLGRYNINRPKKNIYHIYNTCQKNLDAGFIHRSNGHWLEIKEFIKSTNTSAIFKAMLDKKNNIIVKEQSLEITIKEFNMSQRLQDITGFINYTCFFTCNDTIKKIEEYEKLQKDNKLNVCESRGEAMGVLLMPFYTLGSIKTYIWTKDNYNVLKSVIYQVILSLYSAYINEGFLHQDIHLNNVLLKKSFNEKIEYLVPTINNPIRTTSGISEGLVIRIIDYGNSRVFDYRNTDTDRLFNSDLSNFLSRITYDLKFYGFNNIIITGNPDDYISNIMDYIHKLPYDRTEI